MTDGFVRVVRRACGPARMVFGVLAAAAATAAAAAPLPAQQVGRIVGRVLDAQTGAGIAAADVMVVGTPLRATTGLGGRFILNGVQAGEVSLQVQTIGYGGKTVTGIAVIAGGTVEQDITLDPAAVELTAISVNAAAERGSVARAIDQQRNATNIVSAISSEQITRSPDGDAAAAIRRVSGVTVQDGKYVFVRGLGERYTVSALNGARIPSPEPERKVVPLDIFPAGLLQSISTSKTFTPDQPGDFSGAQVDIRTREFPAAPQLSVSASVGMSPGNTFRGAPRAPLADREWFAAGVAPRRIPDEARDMPLDARRGPQINRVVNSFRNVWSVRDEDVMPDLSLGASLGGSGDVFGTRLGYILSGTYSNGTDVRNDMRRAKSGGEGGGERDRYDGTAGTYSVLWGGLANVSLLLGTHSRLLFNNNYNRSADNEARIEVGTDENTRSHVQVERLRYVQRSVRSNQVGGEHQLGGRHRFDWAVTSSGVTRDEPDRSEFVTWLDPEVPIWFNDFEGAVRTFGALDESALEGRLDYRLALGRTTGGTVLRLGGLWRRAERDASSLGFRILTFNWSPTDSRWQLPPEQIFDGRFARDGDDNFQIQRESAGGGYTADDRLLAGYAMVEMPIGSRLRVIAGARVEQTDLFVQADNTVGQTSVADREYTDVLPALSLNYDLTETHKLRLSASQTLARPEYRELAPISYREVLGGEQYLGNADLERILIQNYDLRWEWYPAPAEVISLALFHKRFDQPIEQRYFATSGTDVLTYFNAESATNLGVEAEFSRNLGFLTDRLEALSLLVNGTVMRSEVNTGRDGETTRAMVGQAPWVVNAGLTYTSPRGRTSATLLYNVVGERIRNARASGSTVANVVEESRHVLDLSLRFPVLGMSGKLDLKNLLDEPYTISQGSVIREFYRPGRGISFGLSRSL